MKVAQELARHSTPTLTIGRYAHTRLHDLTQALDRLPGVRTGEGENEAVAWRATGTFDVHGDRAKREQRHPQQNPQQSECFSQLSGAKGCDSDGETDVASPVAQVVVAAGVDDGVRRNATLRKTAPRRTRTFDPLIKSPTVDSVSDKTTSTYNEPLQAPSIFPSTQPENTAATARTCVQVDELHDVISAWPTLPHAVRAGILAMVRATASETER